MITLPFTKSYGSSFKLSVPSLTLEEGSVTAVIGPNGSGKSTLAKVLAGIERPDSGPRPCGRIKTGYMPQKSFAFRMTAKGNLAVNGNDPERMAQLMDALGLNGVASRRAKRLSGGETAKMSLARLLMGSYDLVILDEPTAAMDVESSIAAEALIREYCAEAGRAALLITHSLSQAKRLSDRIIVLHGGVVIEQGDAARVLTCPENEQTRQFTEFYGIL